MRDSNLKKNANLICSCIMHHLYKLRKTLFVFLLITSFSTTEAQWVLKFRVQHEVRVASAADNNVMWFITNYDTLYKTTSGGDSFPISGQPSFIPSGLFAVNKDTAFK